MDIKLNKNQLNRLSEFVSNVGVVFFATTTTPLFSAGTMVNYYLIGIGLILSSGSVIISLFLLKK
ncbi:hypothetical protein COW98_01325 [Candidatus Roizmanbacteria bacterium CG22_combo_CG10-13_8_21_14_all_35_9]|uniref:Uncharacterized protein n=3 Tax=Candidatus Roizmaniibacteriota TaxID=1752723 RepID=A0A2H0BZ49_9BACT|nr:MAG: hypothetical protein COX47_00455 [Candidatus Roizmanbacteria bacterium CG23_combo_of_CG06-09_8_20_14_all_35_49]PIP62947.1 MAG: hypothetical protein COW98_01325 [Candidatus Roizmanbacteria bacterium CG22_combo_CG10-13_8_21_14_all_35_9]PIY71336.1 MAG: hypothetical protein COY88_00810 [Candidatus Roizmanbacteria bacterium CG_4_10_14_0_8_um_filter_35_28]